MDRKYTDPADYMEENFEDIEDSILADLEHSNEEYRALLEESNEMDIKYPFIWAVLYGEGGITLSEKEHAILFEYLDRERLMHDIERRAIYLRGCADAVPQAAEEDH